MLKIEKIKTIDPVPYLKLEIKRIDNNFDLESVVICCKSDNSIYDKLNKHLMPSDNIAQSISGFGINDTRIQDIVILKDPVIAPEYPVSLDDLPGLLKHGFINTVKELLLAKGANIKKSDIKDEVLISIISYLYQYDNSIYQELYHDPKLQDLCKISFILHSSSSDIEKLPIKNELLCSEKSSLFLKEVFSNPDNLFCLDNVIIPLSESARDCVAETLDVIGNLGNIE